MLDIKRYVADLVSIDLDHTFGSLRAVGIQNHQFEAFSTVAVT